MATSNKKSEKNNMYSSMPRPNTLSDDVQDLSPFSLCSHVFYAHPPPTYLFPLQDASKLQPVRDACSHPSQSVTLMAEGPSQVSSP
jgi:hypothetical protein